MSGSTQKTVLQSKKIGDVSTALEHLNSGNPNVIPLVLLPEDRSCCSCLMTVPSGVNSILHRFGKDVNEHELAAPGLHFALACNRIAYCVTNAAVNYNAPVKSCPTADNVMVDCDLTLIFEIGPSPVDVKRFCYKLGARRFDEFLYAAVEEEIRHLIRTCRHTEVYELKGSSDPRVSTALKDLNNKFNTFGVNFKQLAITDVKFKLELQNTLQQTTEYKSRIQEQEKKQKNEMDQIEFRKGREMNELDQQNRRVIQDLQAHRTRVEIQREANVTSTTSEAEVKLTKAKQNASVDETKATSEKAVAQVQGLRKKEELLAKVSSESQALRIRVAQECKSSLVEAESKKVAAEMLARALTLEAEAEGLAAGGLKLKREHELRMAKMEVFQCMAEHNKIVISGEQGEKLLAEMNQGIYGKMTLGN